MRGRKGFWEELETPRLGNEILLECVLETLWIFVSAIGWCLKLLLVVALKGYHDNR